jgi:signal-transduction protein with cAMP-binding, CBS, and nucleotidyltransferase domain
MLGVSIKECMTREVISIDGKTSIRELAKTMRDHGISCVVLQRNGEPCGIVTEKDLVRKCIIEGIDANSSSFKIMSSPLITVDGNIALTKASKLMEKHGIRRLVVTDQGRVVGIITVTDILRISLKLVSEFSRTFEEIEELLKNLFKIADSSIEILEKMQEFKKLRERLEELERR